MNDTFSEQRMQAPSADARAMQLTCTAQQAPAPGTASSYVLSTLRLQIIREEYDSLCASLARHPATRARFQDHSGV